nr:PREDICTED: uncharacterized protein LOC107982873 [Anolis carolinensis]|eukprot:XP_016849246.1 PREDICTED: uncharacterized protein LOC107982873 [Anolis carolinensis]
MLGTALCPVYDKELSKLRLDFPVSSSVQRKQRASAEKRQEKQTKRAETHSQIHVSGYPARTFSLDFQEGLPLTLLGKPVSSYVVQEVLLKDEEDNSEIKLLDLRTDLQSTGKDRMYFPESWPVEHLEGENDCAQPVKSYQIDRVESLIRQLKSELFFFRSENEQILRDLFAKNTLNILNKNAEVEPDKFRSQKLEVVERFWKDNIMEVLIKCPDKYFLKNLVFSNSIDLDFSRLSLLLLYIASCALPCIAVANWNCTE